MKQAEIARVVDDRLIKVQFCAGDNEGSIQGGVTVNVGITKLKLIYADGRIGVCARIIELGAGLLSGLNNRQYEAGQP
jgi:hypothetical protein